MNATDLSTISFVDKSVVSKLQLQGQKASLSVAGIHGSQDVKTEIVPIAVSAHQKSRPLTTAQFYVHEKLKLADQIVELQNLKDRYPHLRNLPNQSYNLIDVQVILGQGCYDIHHPLEFKKSVVLATSSCDEPLQTRKSQKSVQRSSKVPRCSPQRQTSIWTRRVAESDRNYFSLPRTPNSTFSRHRSNVSSSCCPKR